MRSMVLLLSLAAALPSFAADDREAIRKVIGATQVANNTGDVDGWVALFADDAVYMGPGQREITTREALREVARTGFGANKTDVRIEPQEIIVSGDWAFARNRVTGKATMRATGREVPVDVKQIVIYRKQKGGGWKIARLISNSNI